MSQSQIWTIFIQSTASEMHDFVLSLAICHTVVPERDPLDETKIHYQASSPGIFLVNLSLFRTLNLSEHYWCFFFFFFRWEGTGTGS